MTNFVIRTSLLCCLKKVTISFSCGSNVSIEKDQLSTSFSVTQFPENVCGLCLCFSTKIEYEKDTSKHSAGIVECVCLDDFETYEILVERIKSITQPLKLDFNGKVRRTSIRISDNAKKDLVNFYFINSNRLTVV